MSKLAKALTAAAGNAGESLYVEDVFSTYLYTGTDSAQTITNGIDLDGEGGLVWTKQRDIDPYNHMLVDTEQGLGYWLESNTTDAAGSFQHISVNSDGYNILGGYGGFNQSPSNYASWTFRKAEKFFDVVTYTGDGTSNRQIPHNINGSVGFLLIKRTDSTGNWLAWHKEVNPGYGILDLNLAFIAGSNGFVDAVTDTYFETSWLNTSGATYVAYLFASDAGGFGDDGSESIIKCGSYTGNATVDVGFEPQWVMVKRTDNIGNWFIQDNMRGIPTGGIDATLFANLTNAEDSSSNRIDLTATGFSANYGTGVETWIYIAIRRPMKTPESGTEVFAASTRTGTTAPSFPASFNVVDAAFRIYRPGGGDYARKFGSRLTGVRTLYTSSTAAEVPDSEMNWDYMNGWNSDTGVNTDIFSWMFKRATGFFDVVAYTGDGSGAKSFNHNLGVIPELMIVKGRNYTDSWYVYVGSLGSSNRLKLNTDAASGSAGTLWNNTSPTATQFTVGSGLNVSAETNITYLFATLAGVSKVGSYTGNGTSQTIDCGFAAGARFILIKRTDSTGDWYVWDSVRGIVAGNDPYLLLNSTAAEVTTTDYIDPLASGFTVTSTAPAALNASGGTYIFLAIA